MAQANHLNGRMSFSLFYCLSSLDGDDDGDDGEEDFLDVPDKEDYEEDIPEHLREEFGPKPKTVHAPTPQQWQPVVLKMNKKKRPEELDPTTSEATLFRVMEQYKEKHRSSIWA